MCRFGQQCPEKFHLFKNLVNFAHGKDVTRDEIAGARSLKPGIEGPLCWPVPADPDARYARRAASLDHAGSMPATTTPRTRSRGRWAIRRSRFTAG